MLREFGGIQHVLVYRVRRDPQVAPHRGVMPLAKVAPKEFADLAMEFWKTKDYDTTIALAKRAIELDPKFPRSYTYLGMALKEKAEPDAALEALQKGMAIDPKDYLWTHVNIGTLLTDKGRYDEAVAAFKKALEQDPKYGWAWTCMGKAYLGKGDVDAAIDAFEKAAQSDPNDPRGLECLKEAQDRKRGTPRPAPPVISPKAASPVPPKVPAAETKPPVPDVGALIEEGKACLAKSEYDGALAVLRKALERDSNNAQLYGLAALALLGKGDDNGALVSFHKFMALNPEEGKRYEPLIQAAFETKDYNAAWAEVKRLQAEGAAIPRELIQRLEHNSGRKE
jgi:tetratricopeptide (TPR) repeat protein